MDKKTGPQQENYAYGPEKPGQMLHSTQESKGFAWQDAPIEEKIERVRKLTKSCLGMIDQLRSEVSEVLWNHSHEENGQVVIKISKEQKYKLLDQFELRNAKTESEYI